MVANASEEKAQEALGIEFRTPGHIPVCRESPGGLEIDRGTLNWLLQ